MRAATPSLLTDGGEERVVSPSISVYSEYCGLLYLLQYSEKWYMYSLEILTVWFPGMAIATVNIVSKVPKI